MRIFKRKKVKKESITWTDAPDVLNILKDIVEKLNLSYIKLSNIVVYRSFNSVSSARARIWSFPRIWQMALRQEPHYIIEVLTEKYDHLSEDDKKRVLIHELMHIPKNFSGSLVSHKGRYHRINFRNVEVLFQRYQNKKN